MTRTGITRATVALVAVTAAVLSAAHIITLGLSVLPPEHAWQAWLTPLPIDGALLIASMSLADSRKAGGKGGLVIWTTLTVGVLGSITANWIAAPPGLVGKALAVSAPIALALSVELLLSGTEKAPVKAAETPVGAVPGPSEGRDTRETVPAVPTQAVAKTGRQASPEENRRIAETYARQGVTPNRATVRRDHRVGATRADSIVRLARELETQSVPA